MQIALHMGVHCTDGDRLMNCLLRNTDKLGEQGILVPEPGQYRPVVKELMQALKADGGSEDVQQAVLDAVLEDDDPDRIVLSHDSFLGMPGRSVESNRLYTALSLRAPLLRQLFANCELEFFFAIRDPATFIPAAFERAQELRFEKFVEGSDPLTLKWSEMISRMRGAVPDAPVTVWCNEDSPLVWNDILRALTRHDQFTELDGRDDFASELMNRAGRIKLAAYLKAHPPKNHKQHRRIVEAFLEKFARADAIEEVIDVPGWDAGYVAQLTANYEADLATIRDMDGVKLIEP